MSSSKSEDWWTAFYRDFRPIFNLIPQQVTNAQVAYLIKILALKPRQRFLDCPCGIGRISLPLARRGIQVTGVDLQPSYLEELRMKALKGGLEIKTVLSDMRRIDFKSRFDAAGNLWTSFGYFRRESDNLLVVKKIFQALKRRGKFVLHMINRDWIMANFQSEDWYDLGELKVLESRSFDYRSSMMKSTWTYIHKGESKSHDSTHRIYSYHELVDLCERAGFVDIQGFGSTKDEPVTRNSRMLWVVGTKP